MAKTRNYILMTKKGDLLHNVEIKQPLLPDLCNGARTVYTNDVEKALKFAGTADFAVGYAQALNNMLNIELMPVQVSYVQHASKNLKR